MINTTVYYNKIEYLNYTKQKFDKHNFIKNLVKTNKNSDISLSIVRILDNYLLKINVSYGNHNNQKGIFIRAYREFENIHSAEYFISFDKLIVYTMKMKIKRVLLKCLKINFVDTLDIFLEKIFIHYCYVYSENIKLGVLPRPIGVSSNISYEFNFMNTLCFIDFIITQKQNIIYFYIYNKSNEDNYIQIDITTDDISFNSLFKKISSQNFIKFKNEKEINNYTFLSHSDLKRTGFFPFMIIRIQEIMKYKFHKDMKFDDLVKNKINYSFKLHIENNKTNIDFYILEYFNNFSWSIVYYTIKEIESNSF